MQKEELEFAKKPHPAVHTWYNLKGIEKQEIEVIEGDKEIIMKSKKIIAEFPEEFVKSGLYVSKSREVEEIAKKIGIKVKKIRSNDLERVRKILSRGGVPLSKIVREQRKA